MTKLTIIGAAGNIGSTAALLTATQIQPTQLILIDRNLNQTKAVALDISHAAATVNSDTAVTAIKDYSETKDSNLFIITAGFPRQPGMTRDDLFEKNSEIIASILGQIKTHSPTSPVLIVTNPIDAIIDFALKHSGFPPTQILGMSSLLDTSRFRSQISKATGTPVSQIKAQVLGPHNNQMQPQSAQAKVNGKPLSEVLGNTQIQEVETQTQTMGKTIVELKGTGSAYLAPAVCLTEMAQAIITDSNQTFPACVQTQGPATGTPVNLTKTGWQKI